MIRRFMSWKRCGMKWPWTIQGTCPGYCRDSNPAPTEIISSDTHINPDKFFRKAQWIATMVGVGFEVPTPVVMKRTVFWGIAPSSTLKINRRFGGKNHHHLQCRRVSRSWNQLESRWLTTILYWRGTGFESSSGHRLSWLWGLLLYFSFQFGKLLSTAASFRVLCHSSFSNHPTIQCYAV
jgi:hypothetical protein